MIPDQLIYTSSIRSGRGEGVENETLGGNHWLFSTPSPLQNEQSPQIKGTIPGSIGAIIQNYKSGTSRKINTLPGMKNIKIWQINFYDHIIRDDEDYARIVVTFVIIH